MWGKEKESLFEVSDLNSFFSAVLKDALRLFQKKSFRSRNFVTWKKIRKLTNERIPTYNGFFKKKFLVKQILSPENFKKIPNEKVP